GHPPVPKIPPDLLVTSVASPAPRRTAPDKWRQGEQRRFEASVKRLSAPTLLDSGIPANATWLSVSRKSPVKPHSHPLPGQRERQRTLSVSHPLTPANATWLSGSRKSPVNSIAALSLDNVSASERCP